METDKIHLRMMGLGGGVGTKIGGGSEVGSFEKDGNGRSDRVRWILPLIIASNLTRGGYVHRWFSDKYGGSKGALDPPIKMRSAQS